MALRPGRVLDMPVLVCAMHRRDGDLDLSPAQPFRRIRISLTVDLAATDWNEAIAQTQAVLDLDDALVRLGGVANILGVTTRIVRPGALAAEPDAPASGAGG